MQLITIDFETYYSKTYSLSKREVTTEQYIRDKQFETIGVSVQVGAGSPQWFSGTKAATKKFLDQFNWADAAVVAHNAMFDMAILSWHYDIHPKKIIDTLSMARALHLQNEVGGSLAALAEHFGLGKKGTEVIAAMGMRRLDFTPEELAAYGGYCDNDVTLAYKLFKILAKGFPMLELDLIDLTIKMFSEPKIIVDTELLVKHLANVKHKKERLLSQALVTKEDLMSNEKFANLLIMCNVVPPTKISPTTKLETHAFAKTDEGLKALLEHENPLVQTLVAARLGVKSTLEETRTQRFIDIGNRGALPVPLKYYAAHTGRWGGTDLLNLQNVPRGSVLKKAMKAPIGTVFLDCDLSQIECRTLAWWAGQDDLVAAFDRGDDVYKIMASRIYGIPESEVDKGARFVGKSTILGAGYGMGAKRFMIQLAGFGVVLALEECQRIIDVYRSTYPRIPELWKQAQRALIAMMHDNTAPLGLDGIVVVEGSNGIRLPNGLYAKYPGLRIEINQDDGDKEIVYDSYKGKTKVATKLYGAKLIENLCQSLARIIVGEQIVRVSKKYPVVMTVHDAIGSLVPENEAATGLEFVEMCMRMRPAWAPDLPLNCEGGTGASYGECA